MRIQFSGNLANRKPKVFIYTDYSEPLVFNKLSAVADGYTNFDVICIAGGGGRGGGCDDGVITRNYGGEGGGGGFHRVQGLLSALPEGSIINVGGPGADGTSNSDPASTTDGEDGGESQFNLENECCYASGGAGGKRAITCSVSESTEADGGAGGIGKAYDPNGAEGGKAAILAVESVVTLAIDGKDGRLNPDPDFSGWIGAGGGGGAGGVAQYGYGEIAAGSAGGYGAYNPNDETVFGPRGLPALDPPDFALAHIIPGIASGARVLPLITTPLVYGQSGQQGVVVLRVTADEHGLY